MGPRIGLFGVLVPVVSRIATLSTNNGVLLTERRPDVTLRSTTARKFCDHCHKTPAGYPVAQITNQSRRVYMCPAPLPGSAHAMSANGSQVHEFAPPGPPPRRGIRARPRRWHDPRHSPRKGRDG